MPVSGGRNGRGGVAIASVAIASVTIASVAIVAIVVSPIGSHTTQFIHQAHLQQA